MKVDISLDKDKTNSDSLSFNHSTAPFIPDKIIQQTNIICPKVNHSFTSDLNNINYLLLHRRLKHASNDKMNTMCKKQTIKGLPERLSMRFLQCGKDCWICHAGVTLNLPRGITMSTEFLRPGELIHMDFYFMNVTSIRGFTCVLNIVDAKTRNKWEFGTPNKRPPIDTVDYFLTQCKMEGRPVMRIRMDRGGEISRSAEMCNMLISKHKCTIQTTAGYSLWLNGKAEVHNKTSCRMIRKTLFDAALPQFLWCCAMEDCTKVYRALYHEAAGDSPGFLWYKNRPHISEFRTWGCYLEAKVPDEKLKQLDSRIEKGHYMGTSATNTVIKYWNPKDPSEIKSCTKAKFNDKVTYTPDGTLSPGSIMSVGEPKPNNLKMVTLNLSGHPVLKNPIEIKSLDIPQKGKQLHIEVKQCSYHNMPYLYISDQKSFWYQQLPSSLRHNVWILTIGNNDPITASQVCMIISRNIK